MFLAHIIAKDAKQALEIINILMDKIPLLFAVVSEKTVCQKKEDKGELQKSTQTQIIG